MVPTDTSVSASRYAEDDTISSEIDAMRREQMAKLPAPSGGSLAEMIRRAQKKGIIEPQPSGSNFHSK